MKKAILLTLLTFLVIACSSPLDREYNEETLDTDAKEIVENESLSEDETQMMVGWIVRAKLNGTELKGKTYGEILKEAKEYRKEQDELAVKAMLEEEEKREKLGSALTVAMYNKGYDEYDYQEYLTYSLAFENRTEKDIRAFKGSIAIQDLFDTEIKVINLTIDDPILAGEIFKGTYTTNYNQFRDEDVRLKNKDMDDLKVVWNPEKIIFTDGSTLE